MLLARSINNNPKFSKIGFVLFATSKNNKKLEELDSFLKAEKSSKMGRLGVAKTAK